MIHEKNLKNLSFTISFHSSLPWLIFLNKIYSNFQILRNLNNKNNKKQDRIIWWRIRSIRQTQWKDIISRPRKTNSSLSAKSGTNTARVSPITHVTPRNRNSFAPLFDLACYTRLIHPRAKLSSGARGESKLYPDNPNFSRPYKNSARRGGGRKERGGSMVVETGAKTVRRDERVLVKLVSSCRAANRGRRQRRPVDKHLIMERDTSSNEHSPPLLPRYLSIIFAALLKIQSRDKEFDNHCTLVVRAFCSPR